MVELRIIEGASVEEGKDITFDYNANFFLYASLEQARPMAHGRVQNSAALNPPILTGVPASGMAYLDRPSEAGYFIFPDLSVRHEGYFRLSFSLFETTKEERDFDVEPVNEDLPPGVDWRMEIKTRPFNVYSAKKFPGLMESTTLSKTVADQGCRVRIRRDVRMRKRDTKGNGYERREEEFRRRTATPASDDRNSVRGRSLSTSSEQQQPYGGDPQRRASGNESYLVPRLPSLPPIAPSAPSSHEPGTPSTRNRLSFGGGTPASHFATPRNTQQPCARIVLPSMSLLPPTPTSYSSSQPQSPYARPDLSSHHHARVQNSTCPSPSTPTLPLMHERYLNGVDPNTSGLPVALGPDFPARSASDFRSMGPMPPPRTSEGQLERHVNGVKHESEAEPDLVSSRHSHESDADMDVEPRTPSRASSLTSLKIASLVSPLSPPRVIEAKSDAEPELEVRVTGAKRKADDNFSGHTVRMGRTSQRLEIINSSGPKTGSGSVYEPYTRADGRGNEALFNTWK